MDMKPFENFDWTNFWNDSDYAKKAYIGKAPTDEEISEIEKELGYKLPQSYIELIKKHNGGIPVLRVFLTDDYEINITGIFGIDRTKCHSLCGELGSAFMISEWGYPNIGIAVADTISGGHDMIFLDYRACGKDGEPKVVVVDQESDYHIGVLADTFEDFIKGLTIDATEMENEDFALLDENQKCLAIKFLQEIQEEERVIELLNYVGIENLSAELMGMLARSYNNNNQENEAMRIMDMIPEEERKAVWYYRYGYSYASRCFPHNSEADNLKALEMFEKAIEKAEEGKVIEWCMELVEFHLLSGALEKNKSQTPLVYEHYKKYKNEDVTPEAPANDQQHKYNNLFDVNWIFDKHDYSAEEFEAKFNEKMAQRLGENWRETECNAPIEEAEILVTYEAWIESLEQLYDNECLTDDYEELLEEEKEDGMWQVDIRAHLKADNGKSFSVQEIVWKLQKLMANKELGDHVFFEGIDYEGSSSDYTAHEVPMFYVVCGS
uniref:SMI1/KNR4 family protein n=2 Tax=Alloprevotella tannerae TaxID=76122 RepID=A0A929RZM3_9BACT|nr:SMI1/KNR4 family protein [Alloprevotella tannerae]